MTRATRASITTIALYAFSGLLGMSLIMCLFCWVYLPPHDVQPLDHPFDNMINLQNQQEQQVFHDKMKAIVNEQPLRHVPQYHMVFSTSCSPFQDWQSYLFFYFAKKVNQHGTVTRIASDCKDADRKLLQEFHDGRIAVMSDNFKLHFAPPCPDSRSKYFNKPYGLRDFMEKVLGYPDNKHDDDIIMIVDPDMMLLRPLTHTFDVRRITWVLDSESNYDTVKHGQPIAQTYGYGNSWLTSLGKNASAVAGEDSPALKVSSVDANKRYPAGPPYLLTARDAYKHCGTLDEIRPKSSRLLSQNDVGNARVQLRSGSFKSTTSTCQELHGI